MIIVTVELLSAINGRRTKLGEMHIANDGTSQSDSVGHYDGKILRAPLFNPTINITRRARVEDYRRNDVTVWNLVAKMLAAMRYK